MNNLIKYLTGKPLDYHFKVQLFKRGETFHHDMHATVIAESLERAKALVRQEESYPDSDYIVTFEKANGYTQMTVIERDLPG